MRTKLVFSILVLTAALLAAGCGGAGGQGGGGGGTGAMKTAMVTDVGGLGDQSFNDSANAGLQRSKNELGVQTQVLESKAPTDYVNNLTQLSQSGYSPVFAIGFLMTDAVTEVSKQFPNTKFAIVDSVVKADNVASLIFREQESSYLAGIVAAGMTQENTEYTTADQKVVGFLGGQDSDLIRRFQAGYEAGVKSVCPDCKVLVQYAGSTPAAFNDPARGKEISLQMFNQGADVVYHASGATGTGLFEAATEQKKFAIGVDSDQAKLVPQAPILTSAIKRVDNAVFYAVQGAKNGNFPAGQTIEYGLKENGVDLAPFGRFDSLVPQKVKEGVSKARQDIIDGKIKPPTKPEK